MRRALVAAVIAGGLFLVLGGGEALAAVCFNTAKSGGAGNFGNVILRGDFGDEETWFPAFVPTNKGGRVAGGFVDVYFDLEGDTTNGNPDDDDILLIEDTFFLPSNPALGEIGELPHNAHNAGPGDDLCDGIGIDNVEFCPAP